MAAHDRIIDATDFHFPGQQAVYHGKVRDVYDLGKSLLLVATDRYSAFDRNLALIENKGALLTAISRWWFEQTASIIKNHIIGYPDPNVAWGNKYKVVPIEMVVRGYITGVTNTSLWHNYSEGQRDFGDFVLPDGLHKNQQLPEPVLTPTTKFEKHDRPLTPKEAVAEGLVDQKVWEQMQRVALELFNFGQKTAEAKGLILVDTKYEFGQDEDGNLVLIDEIHTPDSSRYWLPNTYQQKIDDGEEPDNYDKEFLRLWFKARFDPYADEATAPEPPQEILDELIRRYAYVYEQLSGSPFRPDDNPDPLSRIEQNILHALEQRHG
ncbi:MAG TPA: phosphoribosylaminoimidazolesuccinocarboxamide synthase [Candidatus Saccharimonadales bacterium]|nr:phosphoribosylaminoimidazolesuccinocarboxamide synthase [Candidatus Saccharimonadales bacterium]